MNAVGEGRAKIEPCFSSLCSLSKSGLINLLSLRQLSSFKFPTLGIIISGGVSSFSRTKRKEILERKVGDISSGFLKPVLPSLPPSLFGHWALNLGKISLFSPPANPPLLFLPFPRLAACLPAGPICGIEKGFAKTENVNLDSPAPPFAAWVNPAPVPLPPFSRLSLSPQTKNENDTRT